MKRNFIIALLFCILANDLVAQSRARIHRSFNDSWKFYLGKVQGAEQPSFNDASWRSLDLPHDWSIELPFDKDSPTGNGGGALRGGIGWYRKTFSLPTTAKGKFIAITFDGVYRNSEVWINGQFVGKRPNGYLSFQYDISQFVKYGDETNVIVVKVDNSQQPNSRWYSGSGIYRNVWMTITDPLHIGYNGTYITTPVVSSKSSLVDLRTTIDVPMNIEGKLVLATTIYSKQGKVVGKMSSPIPSRQDTPVIIPQAIYVAKTAFWSIENPYLYKAVTRIIVDGKVVDEYSTSFGFRKFSFDANKGFILNGKSVKILGVCNHHDLGCLGIAVNKRAIQRQLEILKAMGCNGIRTSHNPPAPELLDLCDEMGFIVMDEAFDMWKKEKNKYDYHLDWDEWHVRDLKDQIIRDRNHPSIFMWSIGNEVNEQWDKKDSSGAVIAKELSAIVRSLDATRPITAACNSPYPDNPVIKSNALDLIGYNYAHKDYASFHQRFPGKKFIATETVSALATRGHYDMPSDSIRRWPERWDLAFTKGNPDTTCSAYDNCSAPWGSTHEETWKIMKKHDFLSGMYIWTGFDYIGEPTPYPWPARSSYFGIIDLAGFPKDAYYMYQSEWTNKPVLHVFPHWNWKKGDTIDVWAYYNGAKEVDLYLNNTLIGTKQKTGDDLKVWWRIPYEPGILKAVSRTGAKVFLTKEIKTAGAPAKVILEADRKTINGNNDDLCFITVKIVDKEGNIVPYADNLVQFTANGGTIVGVDNGSQTSMESFKDTKRKAFKGLCLAVVKPKKNEKQISFVAKAEGLVSASITIIVK